MAEEKKKKPKSIEDIIAHYQEARGKGFKERIKKWEEIHDPENIHVQQFALHAQYVVFGHPSKSKEFPGAYNVAHQMLDKHLKEDDDVLEDEDKLAEIIESYADTFLEHAIGKKFKDTIKHAEEQGMKKKELREFKGQLLAQYHRNEEGESIGNILSDQYIKQLKGKKKIELIHRLRDLGNTGSNTYGNFLGSKAIEGLLSEDDRLEMAQYITPIFEKRGWKHKTPHIARSVQEQAGHYGALLQGAGERLTKSGYKIIKHEDKKGKNN